MNLYNTYRNYLSRGYKTAHAIVNTVWELWHAHCTHKVEVAGGGSVPEYGTCYNVKVEDFEWEYGSLGDTKEIVFGMLVLAVRDFIINGRTK